MKPSVIFAFSLLIVLFFTQACSTTDSFTSKSWHNLNARYNSYFLARETIREVEKELFTQRIENYNRILDVEAVTDTNAFKTHDAKMKDCIKKAANIPNRHDNSKWLDASYVLIGKARYYLRDYDNAINTLKYINTKGKLPAFKNQALIELMRTYIQLEDEKAARAALYTLNKRKMEESEKLDFLLIRGHFFRKQNDLLETAKSLGSAIKIMPKGERRGRIHFILGQIYQKLGNNKLAYKNYKKVFKNNPSYELAFHAKLYMAQVSKLEDQSSTKKVLRYFKKLLKDSKNKEYKDKIYYEMALFEIRQGNTPQAIEYLHESLFYNENNAIQKAYSYLKLGEIYYKPLKEYETAKTYYDSVMTSLPKNVEEYKTIERRHKGLSEFVEQLTIYRMEDSLLRLSAMEEPALGEHLTRQLVIQENKRQDYLDSLQKVQERRAKLKQQNQEQGTLNALENSKEWYFYNPTSVSLGERQFAKQWGNRPLADDWRRRAGIDPSTIDSLFLAISTPQESAEEKREKEIQKRVEARKAEIYEAIPKTEEAKIQANQNIENAGYEVGKIYKFKLNEPENAVEFFETLLRRYPNTAYEPEVLYFLYLLGQELQDKVLEGRYKQQLTTKFPNSLYAKRITDPDWEKKAKENQAEVKKSYKQAYALYESDKFAEALQLVQETFETYPTNLLEDKLMLLKYLILVKSEQDTGDFKENLESFIEKYPDSDLLGYARTLLQKLQ